MLCSTRVEDVVWLRKTLGSCAQLVNFIGGCGLPTNVKDGIVPLKTWPITVVFRQPWHRLTSVRVPQVDALTCSLGPPCTLLNVQHDDYLTVQGGCLAGPATEPFLKPTGKISCARALLSCILLREKDGRHFGSQMI